MGKLFLLSKRNNTWTWQSPFLGGLDGGGSRADRAKMETNKKGLIALRYEPFSLQQIDNPLLFFTFQCLTALLCCTFPDLLVNGVPITCQLVCLFRD
jgi:hypothetical protein